MGRHRAEKAQLPRPAWQGARVLRGLTRLRPVSTAFLGSLAGRLLADWLAHVKGWLN